MFWNWQVAVPATFAAIVAIAALALWLHQNRAVPTGPEQGMEVQMSSRGDEAVEPTVANYQAIANRSFEQFDELLTQEARRHRVPLPVYAAGMLDGPGAAD